MSIILSLLSTFLGAGTSVLMLILLLMASPNSKPADFAMLKGLMWSVVAIGVLGLSGASWAMYLSRHVLATGIGITPAVYCIGLLIVVLRIQR
ncbi:MAG TPA: hypothetical protein VK176_14010 [Phycisphaerales bacterium]|nr:hypothetical protein [Phycisphaerales bacterium]